MTTLHSVPTPVDTPRTRPADRPRTVHRTAGVPSQPVPLRVVASRRYPGPPAPVVDPIEPATGHLLVDATRSALSPHLRGREVVVRVGGRRHACAWGRTLIDLPAGRHLVEIEVAHGGGWGRVGEAVPVAAGTVVPVFYRAPVLPRAAGTVGPSRRAVGARGPAGPAGVAAVAAVVALLAAVLVLVGLVLAVVAGG